MSLWMAGLLPEREFERSAQYDSILAGIIGRINALNAFPLWRQLPVLGLCVLRGTGSGLVAGGFRREQSRFFVIAGPKHWFFGAREVLVVVPRDDSPSEPLGQPVDGSGMCGAA
jgi:hypothetical protein